MDQQDHQQYDDTSQELSHDISTDSEMGFDGSDFDFSGFNKTIEEIEKFSLTASLQDKTIVIHNLVKKMKCLAHALDTLNSNELNLKEENHNLLSVNQDLQHQIFELKEEKERLIVTNKKLTENLDQAFETKKQNDGKILVEFSEEKNILEQRVESLLGSLKELEGKYFELKVRKEHDEQMIVGMEEEIAMIYKFTDLEEKTINQIRHKITLGKEQQFVLGEQQLKELRDFAAKAQQNESLGMISEKTQEEMEENQSYHNLQKRENELKDVISPINNSYNIHKFDSNHSIDSSFNAYEQIKELKNLLSKRSSIQESNSPSDQYTQLEYIEPLNENQKCVISQVKQQCMKRRITQSQRASSILNRLDQKRMTSSQYVTQLQSELSRLKSQIVETKQKGQKQKKENQQYISSCGEKIDELMCTIQEMQVQRIRMEKSVNQLEKLVNDKNQYIEEISEEIKSIKYQNMRLRQENEELKDEMQYAGESVKNLKFSLKTASNGFNQMDKQRKIIEQEHENQKKHITMLQSKVSEFQELLKIEKENNTKNVQKNRDLLQQIQQISELQHKLSEYELCIEELEEKLHEKCNIATQNAQQCQAIKEKLEFMQGTHRRVLKQNENLKSDVETLQTDKKILQKSISDFKYVNELLKNDIKKIKCIDDKDWNKEILENSWLIGSMAKENRKLPKRQSKNFSKYEQSDGWHTQRLSNNNSFTITSKYGIEKQKKYTESKEEIKKRAPNLGVWKPIKNRNSVSFYESKNNDDGLSIAQSLKRKYKM